MSQTISDRRRAAIGRRLNQVTFGLGCFYLVIIGSLIYVHGLFLASAGDDYRAYRTGAQVAWTQGVDHAYDLAALQPIQQSLVQDYGDPALIPQDFTVLATPYLPIYLVLFGPLLLFAPVPGFIAWTLLSVLVLAAYLAWFARRLGHTGPAPLLLGLLLSFPAIDNLQWGQVNVWVTVLFGEFFRATMAGTEARAGFWLAGLLLKPHALVLLAPSLVFTRRWRALAAFVLGSLGVLAACLVVGGPDALVSYAQTAATVSGDASAARPQYQMNWRALAITLSSVFPPSLAWTIAVGVLIGALFGVVALWWSRESANPERVAIVLLGTFAATGVISWHAHSHMALPTVIPLLYLTVRRVVPPWLVAVWLIAPYVSVGLRLFTGETAQLGLLAAHLCLVGWSVAALRPSRRGVNVDERQAIPA
jgi:hypothetical protein